MSAIIDEKGASQVWPGSITQESLAPNVAGNGPCFSVFQGGTQSIPDATFTKVAFSRKEFDTSGAFDALVKYNFQPGVAGYYHLTGAILFPYTTSGNIAAVYRNGVEYKRGSHGSGILLAAVNCDIYLGVTDYAELWCYHNKGSAMSTDPASTNTYFSGFLARAA